MQTKTDMVKGIDVSHHQGKIDWAKVKADGVQFVIIKASEGKSYVDPKFKENYAGAKAAGLKIGFYHYAHPNNDPVAEVEFFLKTINGCEWDIPPALDLEINKALDKTKVTAFAVKWMKEMQKRILVKPIFYSYTAFIKSYINKDLAEFPLWIAHYNVNTPGNNGVWDRWEIFQYTSSGKVAGINGNVDMNVIDNEFWKYLTYRKDKLSDWQKEFQEAVEWAKKEGISDGSRLKDPITREEAIVMIYRLFKRGGSK